RIRFTVPGPAIGPGLSGFSRMPHGCRKRCCLAKRSSSGRLSGFAQFMHYGVELGLGFKTNPRNIRQSHIAILHANTVSEAAERLENVWVGLVTTQVQTRSDIQRHLVPTVWNHTTG